MMRWPAAGERSELRGHRQRSPNSAALTSLTQLLSNAAKILWTESYHPDRSEGWIRVGLPGGRATAAGPPIAGNRCRQTARRRHQAQFCENCAAAGDRTIAARMLERFGVAHLRERPYTMISGGERQLVLLARALAQEPQFVVLDEPTANLDFGNQGKVMREIRQLAASGHGVLFTTHDPNHAMRAADLVYRPRGGECIGQGLTSSMLGRAQLEAPYGGPVEEISDRSDGRIAFLPG
jgi:ABC-type Mn2+/Zn2+ transport system ATPase subunit